MEVRFKNFVSISDSLTQQGLSNHITFRPIKSGATVPLSVGISESFQVCTDQKYKSIYKLEGVAGWFLNW